MDPKRRVTEAGTHGELVALSRRNSRSANEESRQDEYAELVHLIVDGGWNPGDIVRTSKGVRWKFRETPYTTDFPEQEATPRSSTRCAPQQSSIGRLRRVPLT
jgi:hypothetical protein